MEIAPNDILLENLRTAVELVNEGKNSKAQTLFLEVIELNPNLVEPYLWISSIALYDQDTSRAEVYLRKALEVDSLDSKVISNLACILILQDKYEEAEFYLNIALGLDPNNCTTHYYMADLMKKTKKYDRAEYHYKFSIKLSPLHGESYRCLGILYFEIFCDYERSEEYLKIALNCCPNDIVAKEAYREVLRFRKEFCEDTAYFFGCEELDEEFGEDDYILL